MIKVVEKVLSKYWKWHDITESTQDAHEACFTKDWTAFEWPPDILPLSSVFSFLYDPSCYTFKPRPKTSSNQKNSEKDDSNNNVAIGTVHLVNTSDFNKQLTKEFSAESA